jgi:hypothetical protein
VRYCFLHDSPKKDGELCQLRVLYPISFMFAQLFLEHPIVVIYIFFSFNHECVRFSFEYRDVYDFYITFFLESLHSEKTVPERLYLAITQKLLSDFLFRFVRITFFGRFHVFFHYKMELIRDMNLCAYIFLLSLFRCLFSQRQRR